MHINVRVGDVERTVRTRWHNLQVWSRWARRCTGPSNLAPIATKRPPLTHVPPTMAAGSMHQSRLTEQLETR